MKLGFVSAILPDMSLQEVIGFAAEQDFSCVELMCWPHGKAERRYAGVTHIDVDSFGASEASAVKKLLAQKKVSISGLGYYPNPLDPDEKSAAYFREHLKKVIGAAALLEVGVVNTFIGRDPAKTLEENFRKFAAVWPDIVSFAERQKVKIGIENCPMLFTGDEWPGGKNMAIAPAVWRRMFKEIPSPSFGLNLDPSHLVWQQIDYVKPIYEFADRIFHVHVKDAKIRRDKLDEVGILATPLEFHAPKLPGLGDVQWGKFISALTDVGFAGGACIEVEDRSFEDGLESRKAALVLSGRYMRQFVAR
ncbi:MAG TPA: sugar phosphate isomerase/epimerase [Spirochaetia bacterium]|nr:sugar phosphate isomerase/epimerase [Spirochaetia bacterium]